MKIGIILNRVNFEEKKIINSLEKLGHEIVQFNNQRIFFDLNKKSCSEAINNIDVFIQRSLSFSRGLYSTAILESWGKKVINDYHTLSLTGDKLLTTLELIKNDIPTPKTAVGFTKDSTINLIESIMGYPNVIKPIIGSWGRLIAKIENKNMATAILEDREVLGNLFQKIFYIQEFIPTDEKTNKATDIRVFYLNGRCLAAMGRKKQGDDFRSNIAIGGKAISYPIDSEMEKICKKIGDTFGGVMLGIDLMETENGYTCLEVNGTPQFKGISSTTDIDIGDEIAKYIDENYK